MLAQYFRDVFLVFKRAEVVKSQREFAALLGVNDQWLKGVGRKDRDQTRVSDKTAARLKHRLAELEATSPRPLKSRFAELRQRLEIIEQYTRRGWSPVYEHMVTRSH